MCKEIKTLVEQVSCYFPYIIRVENVSEEYRVIRDEKGNEEVLFCDSEQGCIDYLEWLKLECYEYSSQKWCPEYLL